MSRSSDNGERRRRMSPHRAAYCIKLTAVGIILSSAVVMIVDVDARAPAPLFRAPSLPSDADDIMANDKDLRRAAAGSRRVVDDDIELLLPVDGAPAASIQEARLFTLSGQTGASTAVSIKCHNASTCQTPDVIDNTFDSACVDGLWLFYSETDYAGEADMKYGSNTCFDLAFGPDELSSFRYVGSLTNWMSPSVTLFREHGYRGQELYKAFDGNTVISGNSTWHSLIVSGLNDWTLYSDVDYTGVSVCVSAIMTSIGPGFIDGIEDALGVGTIGSVREGCFAGSF